MKRDTGLRAAKRPWVRWCASLLAVVLVLVVLHQAVPHHPSHGRCLACASMVRPSLAATAMQVAVPRPVPLTVVVAPVDRPFHSDVLNARPLRGPPALLAV
jgi:hypothetical protein